MTTTAPGQRPHARRARRALLVGCRLGICLCSACWSRFTVAAVYGLVTDDAYRLVRPLSRATWRAQDAVPLVTLPLLVVAGGRAAAGSFRAHVTAVGI